MVKGLRESWSSGLALRHVLPSKNSASLNSYGIVKGLRESYSTEHAHFAQCPSSTGADAGREARGRVPRGRARSLWVVLGERGSAPQGTFLRSCVQRRRCAPLAIGSDHVAAQDCLGLSRCLSLSDIALVPLVRVRGHMHQDRLFTPNLCSTRAPCRCPSSRGARERSGTRSTSPRSNISTPMSRCV